MSREPIVTTQNGKVRGTQNVSQFSGKTFYSFYGIPFAEPPLGDLRFKPALKPKSWTGIRNAVEEGDDCAQFSLYHQSIVGSEDCLYLNVHVPENPLKIKKPKTVVVQVHSGGHLWGSGTTRIHGSPDFIMHQDVVYVTFSYRLHIFGFLNLRIPEAPGNVGLRDCLMALEWVKDNIANFGGDPNNVTLCGQCSGGSLVHLLMMIPAAKGLYHKVIMMGDYAFNPLVNYRDETVEIALTFVKLLGYKGTDSPESILHYLKSQSTLNLTKNMNEMTKVHARKYGRLFPSAPFLPSIEACETETTMIPKSPFELMSTIDSSVPIMFGVCENEGIFGFMDVMKMTSGKQYKKIFKENCWSWFRLLDDSKLNEMIEEIKTYYYGEKKLYNAKSAVKIYNDVGVAEFYETIANIVHQKSPSTPIYVYIFSYLGVLNNMRQFMGMMVNSEIEGTVHSDDYFYVVKTAFSNLPNCTENDIRAIQNLTTMITKFAKTGDPNDESMEIDWKPTTPENPYHLKFGNKLEIFDGKINHEQQLFWERLKKKYFPIKYTE